MQFERFGDQYVLRLETGEAVMATLTKFVQRENIRGGYFVAFGAFSQVRLRYFDIETKQYRDHDVDQQVEVVSVV